MADDLTDFIAMRGPVPGRPLLGLTVLVVEDSRFACDAMRLLCLRSGARIRRADCLRSARRHLQTYRPAVVIVDLGLPDGSGEDLIAELAAQSPRTLAIVATSGDTDRGEAALAAGADAFMPKPVESLAVFQKTLMAALPATGRGAVYLTGGEDLIAPDPLAFRDDLSHAADLLGSAPEGAALDYVARFLSGLARSAHDGTLETAATELLRQSHAGKETTAVLDKVSGLVRERLESGVVF